MKIQQSTLNSYQKKLPSYKASSTLSHFLARFMTKLFFKEEFLSLIIGYAFIQNLILRIFSLVERLFQYLKKTSLRLRKDIMP